MAIRFLVSVLLGSICILSVSLTVHAQTAKPRKVFLTWMSITNWLFEVEDTRIVMEGYISRIPKEAFSGPSFAKATPTKPDEAGVTLVANTALKESVGFPPA